MVKTVKVPNWLMDTIANLIKEADLKQAAELLKLNEKSVLRLAAGVPSIAGTLLVAEKAIEANWVPRAK